MGTTEDEMFALNHSLDMSLSKLRESEGQGSQARYSPRGRRVGHDLATEQANKNPTDCFTTHFINLILIWCHEPCHFFPHIAAFVYFY